MIMDYTMKAYGNTWMLRYCTLEQWKDAIAYASTGNGLMFNELRYAYKATRTFLLDSPRNDDMVKELDGLFKL